MVDQTVPPVPITNKEAFQALLTLDEKERNFKSRKSYLQAYIWSVLLPPIGIYYFFKYLFFANGTRDDFKAGITSLVLTVISLVLSILLFGFLFQQVTSSFPSQGTDVLKELVTPANQKTYNDLYQ